VASIPGGIFFGWLGDRIGRRKVFMMMILTLSFVTGVTALAPENGWIFIAAMRFIVGLGVGGIAAVDLPWLQEFVPASKRGWVSGLSIGLLPLGPPVSSLIFRGQRPSPGRSWGSGGSGEPIEAFGKLQDCFSRAGIGQRSSHLSCLLGTVEPLHGFIQNRWHLVLRLIEN
jgi:hypothetical protein